MLGCMIEMLFTAFKLEIKLFKHSRYAKFSLDEHLLRAKFRGKLGDLHRGSLFRGSQKTHSFGVAGPLPVEIARECGVS